MKEVELASLFRRFEQEYGAAYLRLAAQLRESYPELTSESRRTGRALRNICFFAWCSCRDGDWKLIPALVHAAALLAAQDDYYDNPRIPTAQKESFCAATNAALRTHRFRRDFPKSRQLRDLTALWSYVARTIPRRSPEVRSFWSEAACQLNDAMVVENRTVRQATITYDEYMRTAVHSIGMVFIWATYLAHERVAMTTVRKVVPVLVRGAKVVRLSNDMASYRQRRNKANAVSLVGGSGAAARVRRLVMRESRAFHESVEALDLEPRIRGVLLHSLDFLREFYRRSDFHRGPVR